jgi:hypothetical protein
MLIVSTFHIKDHTLPELAAEATAVGSVSRAQMSIDASVVEAAPTSPRMVSSLVMFVSPAFL